MPKTSPLGRPGCAGAGCVHSDHHLGTLDPDLLELFEGIGQRIGPDWSADGEHPSEDRDPDAETASK